MKISLVGAGSFGTSLANFSASFSKEVLIFTNSNEKKNEINFHSMNSRVFPSVILKPNLRATNEIAEIFLLDNDVKKDKISNIIFVAIPSFGFEDFLRQNKDLILSNHKSNYIIFCTKGIAKNGLFFDELINEIFGKDFMNFGFLLGPSFAIEILNGEKTFVNLVSRNKKETKKIIEFLNSKQKTLKIFFEDDLRGAQICSMMKNICAIFLGILKGANFDDDFCAAFFTFFLKEILELILLCSEKKSPLKKNIIFSFAGIGDLFLTSTSKKSRNFSFGFEIGELKGVSNFKNKFQDLLSRNQKPEGFFAVKNLFGGGFLEKHGLENEKIISKLPLSKKLFDFFDQNHENFSKLSELTIISE